MAVPEARPAIFAGLLILFGISHTTMGRETLVASAMPLSTPCVLFAAQYKEFEAEAATLMLLTTLATVVAPPSGLFLSNYLLETLLAMLVEFTAKR